MTVLNTSLFIRFSVVHFIIPSNSPILSGSRHYETHISICLHLMCRDFSQVQCTDWVSMIMKNHSTQEKARIGDIFIRSLVYQRWGSCSRVFCCSEDFRCVLIMSGEVDEALASRGMQLGGPRAQVIGWCPGLCLGTGGASRGIPFASDRRGLSKFFTGKSQSFTCIADSKCVADLHKPENHQSKKRKKQSDISEGQFLLPISCRSVLSSSRCPPCIDV